MKRIIFYIHFLIAVAIVFVSCGEPFHPEIEFKESLKYSIYTYLMEHKDDFSSFISILEVTGLDKTLSAYNPYGLGYTLFLPDNKAIDEFIKNNDAFGSLQDILENRDFCELFSRYHVLNMGVRTQDFPFGAFPEPTLSNDYLTVSFMIETDTSYYKINNQAAVIKANIKVSNGYIHQIASALVPITYTSYEWLQNQDGCSIFKEAIDMTGLQSLVDFDVNGEVYREPVTLLIEPDTIYNKTGIYSVNDLASFISPSDDDYTNINNPLNSFMRYHILKGSLFLNDFADVATNYTTLSDVPLNINGLGLDIMINKGKQIFDTLVEQGDSTFIDYITFLYDKSNIITQNGAIHFIDRVMTKQNPSRANKNFGFYEEPLFQKYRLKVGTYLIEDTSSLSTIRWSGADLFFVELGEQESSAWDNDYLQIEGNFKISYKISKIVQGKYDVFIAAEAFNEHNALIEVYIDGKKISGLIDLTKGGTTDSPFQSIKVGSVDFKSYTSHIIEIIPLIPGRFLWDYIQFNPI